MTSVHWGPASSWTVMAATWTSQEGRVRQEDRCHNGGACLTLSVLLPTNKSPPCSCCHGEDMGSNSRTIVAIVMLGRCTKGVHELTLCPSDCYLDRGSECVLPLVVIQPRRIQHQVLEQPGIHERWGQQQYAERCGTT